VSSLWDISAVVFPAYEATQISLQAKKAGSRDRDDDDAWEIKARRVADKHRRWLEGTKGRRDAKRETDWLVRKHRTLRRAKAILAETEQEKARRWQTAIHEASHAAIAITIGLGVQRVSIVPAQCVPLRTGRDTGVVALAGSEGVRQTLGVRDVPSDSDEARYAEAVEDPVEVFGDGSVKYGQAWIQARRKANQDRAERLVRDNRRQIEAVAEALMKEGRLNGYQVKTIIEGVPTYA